MNYFTFSAPLTKILWTMSCQRSIEYETKRGLQYYNAARDLQKEL